MTELPPTAIATRRSITLCPTADSECCPTAVPTLVLHV